MSRILEIPAKVAFEQKAEASLRRQRHSFNSLVALFSLLCLLFSIPAKAQTAPDACSTWVPLACNDYVSDRATAAILCTLENKTISGAVNSFDTGLRPTTPTSPLTYCVQASYYEFNIPAAVRNTTRTLVTLIGSIGGVRLNEPTDATKLHVVTNLGVEYPLGQLVHGYNTVIGQQADISRPLPQYMSSTAYSYPYNGVLTCFNQAAYQPWRIPVALQNLGIAKVRIYDPSLTLKVYSITVDTCDSYSGFTEVDTWMGTSTTNSSVALDPKQTSTVAPLDVNIVNVWPICAAACYSQQVVTPGSGGVPCVGWFLNSTSRLCYLLQNMAALRTPLSTDSTWRNNSVGWVGILPPRVRWASAIFSPGSLNPSFPTIMFSRPDLLGGFSQMALLFTYRADVRRTRKLFLRSSSRFAVASTQPAISFLTLNKLTSYVTDFATGTGGRISDCGSPTRQATVGAPLVNNASISRCTQFGYCPPQTVGTSSGSLVGRLTMVYQENPATAVSCGGGSARMASMLLVAFDGVDYQGATYSLATLVSSSTATTSVFTTLVANHYLTSSASLSIIDRSDVSLVDSGGAVTAQSLVMYQVTGLLPSGGATYFKSPTWFWTDSDQRPSFTSVQCTLETAFSYSIVQGNAGYPTSRYNCNISSSLMDIVDLCNSDLNCTGVTTLAVNSTTEIPWCMISNQTVDTTNPDVLNSNATLLVKGWNRTSDNPDALLCRFPTYGSYGVTVRVAQGVSNGNIIIKADNTTVATCPGLTGQVGEDSCLTFTSCFSGTVPKETNEIVVQFIPGSFPLMWQCSATAMRAIVTFDGLAIVPIPTSNCIYTANTSLMTSCNTRVPMTSSVMNGSCGATGGSRYAAGIPSPSGSACSSSTAAETSVSFTLPGAGAVLQTLYLSLDLSNATDEQKRSAMLSVHATDGLHREVTLGYVTASTTSGMSTLSSSAIGWSPYQSTKLCSNATFCDIDWGAQITELPVSQPLFINGITKVTVRGANVTTLGLSGLITNIANCPLPLRRNASANELMFYFVAPGTVPTTGLVISTSSPVADFMACAVLCGDNAYCGVYTYDPATQACTLRNAAGRWMPAAWPMATGSVVSGTRARGSYLRSFSTISAPTGFASTVDLLAGQFQYVLLFSAQTLPDDYSVVLQFPSLTAYQISVLQTGFAGNGAVMSGLDSYGAAQVCGNDFDAFITSGGAAGVNNDCSNFITCQVVYPTVATTSPLHIRAVMSSTGGNTTTCGGGPLMGLVGYNGGAAPSSNAEYSRVTFVAQSAVVSPQPLGTVVTEVFNVTYKGAATKFVLRESASASPTILSSTVGQSSYCRIRTKTTYQVYQLSGLITGTSYGCGTATTLAAAMNACNLDALCLGFTMSSTNTFGCYTTSASYATAPSMFMRKISTTSCTFTVQSFSMVSVSVLDNGVYQGSGNNVQVKWNGRVVRMCGSSRPFVTPAAYSTSTTAQCSTYLECFNDLLPGVGTVEVVFPSLATSTCSVYQSAVVVITPQSSGSQQVATNAGAALTGVRTIKYSPSDISFNILQYGATRVGVHIKQDRFFAVGSVQTFALNVSVGSQVMSLCGGTVGFTEGLGMDSQCQTYYYCGPTTQNNPIAYPSLTGPITITMENKTLCVTTNCNGRFDALVLTDGMLLTAMPSQSYFRSMSVYTVTSGNYTAQFGSNPSNILSYLRSNTTRLGLLFPSLNASRTTVYGTVFTHYTGVTNTADEYLAIVDDRFTNEETKTLTNARGACIIDDFTDETIDQGCQFQLGATQNKILVSAAQTNFNQIGRTISVIVNDVTVATCGGDNQFQGYQGLTGLCNNYFTCYNDWVTAGALVRLVFSSAMASTSTCSPAAMALIDASSAPYVAPLNCSNPAFPFACQADRKCLAASLVCNDVNDCSDRSDEGRCQNWRFAGTDLGFPASCPPLSTVTDVTREECVRNAVILQSPTVFQFNASVCRLFSCVDFSAPNASVVTIPGDSFETWVYTTDPTSFLYCTDALHCNNNGVVASSVPPCTCSCLDDYTGDDCGSQLQLYLVESVVGVLQPGVAPNSSVSSFFLAALLNYLATGSIVSLSAVEQFNLNKTSAANSQLGMYVVITDYTGAALTTFQLNTLLVYNTRASIVSLVPGLESLTATSVVGPMARLNCYKTSIALEGTNCSVTTFINNSKTIFVTVVGISFTSSSQYVDVTLYEADGSNSTSRCGASDFTQYRDTTLAGVCSYRSICALTVEGVRVTKFEVNISPNINPGNIVCNGYELVSNSRVVGAIQSANTGALLTSANPSYSESHDISYTIITAALCAIGIVCIALLISWFRLRRKYEKLKYMGPPIGFFAFAFIFGGLCGLAFYVGSATQTYTHRVLFEEYREPTCEESFFASIPTRVSYLEAQAPQCELINAIGPAEGLTYAMIEVYSNGTTPYALFRRGSRHSCSTETTIVVPLGVCIKESLIFPEKSSWELSYMRINADTLAGADARLSLLSAYNPTLLLTTTTTTESVSIGERFSGQSGLYGYFQSGTLTYQDFTLSGATEDHFALLGQQDLSAAQQQTPTLPQYVTYNAVITTASTALSSAETITVHSLPFVATRNNFTAFGQTFNNFNSTSEDALETSGPYATDFYSFFGMRGTSTDGGRGKGFTVAFWVQASNQTRGFVYALVDGWITSLDYASKIFDRLCSTVESGSTYNSWFEKNWQCYHAVYLSGQSETLAFVTASPENGLVSVIWDLKQIGLERVFDGGWHYVSVVVDNSVATSPTARLYVDGQTETNQEGWYQCITNQVKSVQHYGSGATVSVINNRQESVKDDGALLLGALNARIFDLSVHDSAWTQEELVREGAPGMELYSSIARVESLGLGITTLLFALINLFFTGRHLYNHFFALDMSELEQSSDDELDVAKTAGSYGAKKGDDVNLDDPAAAAAAVSGGTGLTAIFNQNVPFYQFIQPVLLTIQVMALYMYAWDWPTAYTDQFFPGFAIVSIDFQVMYPTTSPVTWPLVQFALASILLLLLIALAWRDRDNFRSIVVQFTELLRIRRKRANPFGGAHGPTEARSAKPNYQWVYHQDDGTVPLTDEQEETLVRNLQALMARRLKTDANMRLHTPRLVDMGSLGTGILLYERLNGKVFISFRASDHTALEDRDARKITLTQTTIECVADNSRCPEHDLLLLPDDLMQYSCVHSSNPYYRSMECPKKCVMYACPHELCDYAVCEYCYNGGTMKAAVSGAIAAFNQLKRRGFFKIVGMALVELASAVYLPVVKSAMMVMGCHSIYICTFGECWNSFTWEYVLGLLFAFTALIFFGAGYFVINAVITFERHFLLRESLPHRPIHKRLFSFLPEFMVREVDYDDFMQIDDSLFVTLYEPFRFRTQWFPVVLYVFRFALPGAVFITDTGGLPQLLAAVVLEAFLSLSVVITAPFKSVWIELTSRLGSIHQFVLLGLMSLHRVYIRDNPGSVGYGTQMVTATVVYLILVGILLVILVIVPTIQGFIEARRRKQREEANSNQNENYDIGVWGEPTSRAMRELEEKKKRKNGDDFTSIS
ncbi:transmembrane protein, putative [Bodo saltans]|uniref:Transmembrane protein, putative n=1 Tax=Bodo saltans TaxID=75058 RepID=A0A0S4JXK8_BODSA|nr:transmembrane protein, putative [Bodo saltans]|eukprot:CUG94138.1 transmembrane protein, putative [Bodo saltans]